MDKQTTPTTDREAAEQLLATREALYEPRNMRGSFGDTGNAVRLFWHRNDSVELTWLVYGPIGQRFAVPGGEYASAYELMECRPELSSVTDWQAGR